MNPRARAIMLGLALLLIGAPGVAQESTPIGQGKKLFTDQGCYGCHTVGKIGTPIGPDLSRVGFKYRESYLYQWLKDPSTQKPTAHMPKIAMAEAEAQALAAFLASLR
jgi:mono/diheme cytochrome c family protein